MRLLLGTLRLFTISITLCRSGHLAATSTLPLITIIASTWLLTAKYHHWPLWGRGWGKGGSCPIPLTAVSEPSSVKTALHPWSVEESYHWSLRAIGTPLASTSLTALVSRVYSGAAPQHSHLGLIEYIHSHTPTSLSLLPLLPPSDRAMLAFKPHLMWIIAFPLLPGVILTARSHRLLGFLPGCWIQSKVCLLWSNTLWILSHGFSPGPTRTCLLSPALLSWVVLWLKSSDWPGGQAGRLGQIWGGRAVS